MSFTTQLMQEFQRFCGVMFGATRNPMLRCGVATRRQTVDSSRPGTAMLDIEPFVKLLRTLVVSVSESSLNRCCMSKASRCDELSQRENTEVVFLILVVHSTAKSGSSGSSEKLGGLFLDFFMVER